MKIDITTNRSVMHRDNKVLALIIIATLAALSPAMGEGINGKFIAVVAHLESGGELFPDRAVGDGGDSNGAYQIKAEAWECCNKWLRANNHKTWAYKPFVNDPTISHYYCKIYLSLKLRELGNYWRDNKIKDRSITYMDVYAAYNMGFRGYTKIGCDFRRHPFQKKMEYIRAQMSR